MLKFDNENNVKAFKAKTEDEVVKVKDCTFANEKNDVKSKFYFCPCSMKDCSPICEACALSCHKHHEPSVTVEGIYECKCGVNNHVISQKLETYFTNVKRELKRKCFYYEFFKFTANQGYFKNTKTNAVICCICKDVCQTEEGNEFVEVKPGKNQTCQCEKHYEENILNINQDLLKDGVNFQKYLLNFNFNLINAVPASHKIYFEFLKEKVEDYGKKAGLGEVQQKAEAYRFFKDFFLFNLLVLFDQLTYKYKNKFYNIGNFFGADKELVIKLFNEPMGNVNENDAKDLTKTKFMFGKFIYFTFLQSFINKYNNHFNHKTILNMNIFQRELYLLEAKNFFKLIVKANEEEKEKSYIDSMNDLPLIILEMYENCLKINENIDIFEEISTVIFRVLNRVFKKLIKYGLVNDEQRIKYFEFVLDTISLYNDRGVENFTGNSYYIMKSIFYALIYKNDKVCLMRMRGEQFPNDKSKTFAFATNEDSDVISKVFVFILNRFRKTENQSGLKILKYDFIVKKIMELMIGEGEFYKKSIENLLQLPYDVIENGLNPYKTYNSLNRKMFDELRRITWMMQDANSAYDEYKIDLPTYIETINKCFKSVEDFMVSSLGSDIPNLKKTYQIYPEFCTRNMGKIREIQNCVKYSNFINQISHCLKIYSDAKKFYIGNKIDMNTFPKIEQNLLKSMVVFFYVIVDSNPENVCLLMNLEAEDICNAFNEVKETAFDFLQVLSDMLFTNQSYKFDNFSCFCELISYMANKLTFEDNMSSQVKIL